MPICRPKHQVLILKCYPKGPRDNLDVKPNSSELSYLLYYATTRRAKLQKIGSFLTKKTNEDIAKKRLSHVTITLQIFAALISKSPKDLPLYVRNILGILASVLRSQDLGLVEASLPTFEAFCRAHDGRNLAADAAYLGHYESVVQSYAVLAVNPPKHVKIGNSKPIEIRWRIVGLRAVKAVAASEALGIDSGRQLGMIIPVILQNLHADRADYLLQVQRKYKLDAEAEKGEANRPRASFATTRTTESNIEKPGAASTTMAEADLADEQDLGVLALGALQTIFVVSNRGQARNAVVITSHFIMRNGRPSSSFGKRGADWGSTLIEMITNWVPVQDRFVVLIAMVHTLTSIPPSEEHQLILTRLIDWLLCSKMNLIGLSVMDVLIDLAFHIRRLIRTPRSPPLSISKPPPPSTKAASKNGGAATEKPTLSLEPEADSGSASPAIVSNTRLLVIKQLKTCLGSLGNHIYYNEQIPDMVTRLLNHIKFEEGPVSVSGESPVDKSAKLLPDFQASNGQAGPRLPRPRGAGELDECVLILEAIKEILIVSNNRTSKAGSDSVTRNRVTLSSWEGSEILIENDNFQVRLAYVDALITWLRQEIGKAGWKSMHERSPKPKGAPLAAVHGGDLQKHMFTAAAYRERSLRRKGRFLQLLQISIYDCALRFVRSEYDILLIHLLLSNLVEWLSVLEISVGLPMIMQLQDDIQDLNDPASQIRLASLVHGYLSAVVEKFSFASSPVGREIQLEVIKRKERKAWCDRVRLTPLPADAIASLVEDEAQMQEPDRPPVLRRFEDRSGLVEQIASSFATQSSSMSPPTSPGRNFARPILSSPAPSAEDHELPTELRSEMQAGWSKEALLASIADEHWVSQRTSLNSRNGGSATNLVETGKAAAQVNGNGSLAKRGLSQRLREIQQEPGDDSPVRWSDSSRSSTLRVDDLKRILAGAPPPSRANGTRAHHLSPQNPIQTPSSDGVSSMHGSDASLQKEVGIASAYLPPPTGSAMMNEPDLPPSRDSGPIRQDLSSFAGGPQELSSPKKLPAYTDTTQSPEPPAIQPPPSDSLQPSASSHQLRQTDSPPLPSLPNSFSFPGAFPASPSPSGHHPRSSRDHVGGFVFRNSYFEAQPRGDGLRFHDDNNDNNSEPIDMSESHEIPDEHEDEATEPRIPIGRAISPEADRVPMLSELPTFAPSARNGSLSKSALGISQPSRPKTADSSTTAAAAQPGPAIPPHPPSPPPIPTATPRAARARSTSGAPRDRMARSRSRGRGDRSGITSGMGQMGAGDVKAFLSMIDVGGEEERPKTGVARPPY